MKKILFLLVAVLAFSLRIFQLGENPPALYWDETSLGYNAYTIATSLRDEFGEFLPLARFIAFGDYKPPGYIYATVPSVLLFGLNEFAVRFPSMLAGFLMVVLTYYLTKELFGNEKISLLSSFILAASSWAVHFSRAAFEANLAAAFNLAGIYFFLVARRKGWLLIVSIIFFILSFYTFNANRIIAPSLFIILFFLNLRTFITTNKKWICISIIVSLILVIPSISYLTSRESRLRFQEVSIFNNLRPIEVANQRIAVDGNSWWAKLLHNRRILFASDFLKHYFDNFSGRFLFTHGDVNPRLAVQTMGQLYVWDLPFLLFGLYWLIRKRERNLSVLIAWMLIAPIPAATARETPHALRILSILPTYQIIIAYGLYQLVVFIKRFFSPSTSGESWLPLRSSLPPPRWFLGRGVLIAYCFMFLLSTLLAFNIYYYLHDYYIHYPRDWSGEWQYGYKEMVSYVSSIQDKYDKIFVTNSLGRPYIYFAFYEKYPLEKFLAQRVADRDWFGFWDVKALGKIQFELDSLPKTSGKILFVTTPNNLPQDFHLLTSIKNPAGEDVFLIAERI